MVWTAILEVIINAFTGPRTGLVCHTRPHQRHSAAIAAQLMPRQFECLLRFGPAGTGSWHISPQNENIKRVIV